MKVLEVKIIRQEKTNSPIFVSSKNNKKLDYEDFSGNDLIFYFCKKNNLFKILKNKFGPANIWLSQSSFEEFVIKDDNLISEADSILIEKILNSV